MNGVSAHTAVRAGNVAEDLGTDIDHQKRQEVGGDGKLVNEARPKLVHTHGVLVDKAKRVGKD